MTDGDEEKTVPWVKELEVRYAYGYDHAFPWVIAFNIWTYPYALLVAPSGAVVWAGHPASLDEKLLRQHLKNAVKTPLFEWPKELADARQEINEGRFADALAAVRKAAQEQEELKPFVEDVERLVAARIAGLRAAFDAGDYATVLEQAPKVQNALGGLPAAKEVEALLDRVLGDEEALVIWGAQLELRGLSRHQVRTRKEADDVIAAAEELTKTHPDTAVSREGAMVLGWLRRIRPRLP